MFAVTDPQQCVSAASSSNVDAEAVNTTGFAVENSDDHNPPLTDAQKLKPEPLTNIKVCRACLAVSVKMHHMSKYKLIPMFERVVGVEINAEDKLPKMLCWECAARLKSANNFIDKAFKCHWLLVVNSNGGNLITMNAIESIDRAQYQLESTLGPKYYEVNNNDLHIQSESDITSEDYDATNVELLDNCGNRETEFHKPAEVDIDVETEQTDVSGQHQTSDFQAPKPVTKENLNDEVNIDSVRNISEASKEKSIANKKRNVCKVLKKKRKHSSTSPLSDRSKGLLCNKEVRVMIEDVMLNLRKLSEQNSFKVVKFVNFESYFEAKSIKKKKTVMEPPINKKRLKKDDNIDSTNTIDTAKLTNKCTCTVLNCTDCDYKTNDKDNLRQHIRRNHNKNNVYNCGHCDFKAYVKTSLSKHINRKHSKNILHNCPHCSYKTFDKSHLNYHVNAKHTKKTVFNCTNCDYKTYDKSTLRKHENAIHMKNTVFNCSFCDFKTYDRSSLRKHMNTKHTHNTVYKCSSCSYGTYDMNNLNRHINSKHTRNISYDCSYCSYKAFDPTSLRKHTHRKHANNGVGNN